MALEIRACRRVCLDSRPLSSLARSGRWQLRRDLAQELGGDPLAPGALPRYICLEPFGTDRSEEVLTGDDSEERARLVDDG